MRLQIIAATCAFAAVVSGAQDKPPVYFVSPCECKNNHGEDRWNAKTEWAAMPTDLSQFRAVQPSDIYRWAPLPGVREDSKRKSPEEEQWCNVTGTVTEVRVQADGDIHFEMTDASGKRRGHILAEVPLGHQWCELRRVVFGWTRKGTAFQPFKPSGIMALRVKPVITVSGKAFFDVHHAGKTPLTNRNITHKAGNLAAWEIHPVAKITVLSAKKIMPRHQLP
jgi:hypothetical protein